MNRKVRRTQKENSDSEKERSIFKKTFLPALFSLAGTVAALYPSNPNNVIVPSRDSGVFLYVGWRILNGEIPYRDVWDHKPPLIYYIDALGLSLTPNTTWGVWTIELVFVFLTLFFIYKTLDKEFGFLPAVAGTIMFTSGFLTIIDRGNVTEEYALLFQAIGIYLFSNTKEKNYPIKQTFWIGLYGGLAFYLKQTTIAVWVVFVLLVVLTRFTQKKLPVRDLMSLTLGWLIPIAIFALYFYFNGALRDFWDQAFAYNFLYIRIDKGLRILIPVFTKGFAFLRQGWVLHIALAGWLTGSTYLWLERKELLKGKNLLILFAVLALPFEILFLVISGRSILHYYLTPLPVMALSSGIFIYTTPNLLRRILSNRFIKGNAIALALIFVLILAQTYKAMGYHAHIIDLASINLTPVREFITTNTTENDKLLIIGAESAVNFLTRRESPTRYVYQYPLALTGKRLMFEEYFNQILQDMPTLIIDTRGKTKLTEKLYISLQQRSDVVKNGVQYLGEHYQQVAQFGEWFVYRLVK